MNILADRLAVPEFLQENCTPANLTAALRQLLTSPEARDTNRKDHAPRVLFILNNLVLALCNAVSPPTRALEYFQDNRNRAIRPCS